MSMQTDLNSCYAFSICWKQLFGIPTCDTCSCFLDWLMIRFGILWFLEYIRIISCFLDCNQHSSGKLSLLDIWIMILSSVICLNCSKYFSFLETPCVWLQPWQRTRFPHQSLYRTSIYFVILYSLPSLIYSLCWPLLC